MHRGRRSPAGSHDALQVSGPQAWRRTDGSPQSVGPQTSNKLYERSLGVGYSG